MKKNLVILIIYLLSVIFLFIAQKLVSLEINNFTLIFLYKYIPNIIPFLIINNLFVKHIDFKKLSSYLKNAYLLFDILIILICIISGIPGSGSLISKLEEEGIYTSKKSKQILYNFSSISIPFIYSITNKNLLLIFILILSSTISYLLTNKELTTNHIPIKTKDNNLTNSIFTSLSTIYLNTTIIVLISIPIKLLLKDDLIFFPLSFLETSFPAISLVKSYPIVSYFVMTFTSLSLILQLKNTYRDLYINKYIKKRLFIASLTTITYFLFY